MLSVGWDTIRLFLHVLAATVWVGGQPNNAKLAGQVATVFKGETLHGLLLELNRAPQTPNGIMISYLPGCGAFT